MRTIKAEQHQCVLASFAMVMDTTMEDLAERLGHNGLERILDDNAPPEPYCFRSHHPQEFVDILLDDGFSLTMVELNPMLMHADQLVDHTPLLGTDRFFLNLVYGDGVLFGTLDKGAPHAVAWCAEERKIYDPRGYTWQFNKDQDFHPLQFFLVQKVVESNVQCAG